MNANNPAMVSRLVHCYQEATTLCRRFRLVPYRHRQRGALQSETHQEKKGALEGTALSVLNQIPMVGSE